MILLSITPGQAIFWFIVICGLFFFTRYNKSKESEFERIMGKFYSTKDFKPGDIYDKLEIRWVRVTGSNYAYHSQNGRWVPLPEDQIEKVKLAFKGKYEPELYIGE